MIPIQGARASPKNQFYKTYAIVMLVAGFSIIGVMGYTVIDNNVRPTISTSSYHFNVQYRAGNETAMNEVVDNSLVPILLMYYRHPTWKADIEFQAMMVEHMAKMDNESIPSPQMVKQGVNMTRIELLQAVVQRGQVELICMQYSDALALAYPYIDWYKSISHAQFLLEKYNLTMGISRAVLLQEGQFFLGASRQLLDFRRPDGKPMFDTFLTGRHDLAYFGVEANAPIYSYTLGGNQINVLPYGAIPQVEAGAIHHVLWFQDGENVNAGEGQEWEAGGYVDLSNDSYHFPHSEARQANHEARLQDLENQGNIFMTLDEWVDYLIARGERKPLDKWVPETHWQPFNYRSSFIWMGEAAGGTHYDDGEITARNYKTHQFLLATEILLNYSIALGTVNGTTRATLEAQMNRAWLDLAEAQVTDSTGLGPREYEGEYAVWVTKRAMDTARWVQQQVVNATPALYSQIVTNGSNIQVVPGNYDQAKNLTEQNWSKIILFDNASRIGFQELGSENQDDLPVQVDFMNPYSKSFTTMRLENPWDPSIDGLVYHSVKAKFNEVHPDDNVGTSRDWFVTTDPGVSFKVERLGSNQWGHFKDTSTNGSGTAIFTFKWQSVDPWSDSADWPREVSFTLNVSSLTSFSIAIGDKYTEEKTNVVRGADEKVVMKFNSTGGITIDANGTDVPLGNNLWSAGTPFDVSFVVVNETHSSFRINGTTFDNGGLFYPHRPIEMGRASSRGITRLVFKSGDAAVADVMVDNINASWRWAVTSALEENFEYLVSSEHPWTYVDFLGNFSSISYSPSMWDDLVVNLTRSDYPPDTVDEYGDWDSLKPNNNEIFIALANGLVYSPGEGVAIVKNCSASHLCARWTDGKIRFLQTATYNTLDVTWEFFVLENVTVDQAVAFANTVNPRLPVTISEVELP